MDDRRPVAPRHAGAVHRDDAAVGLPRFPARRGRSFPGFSLAMERRSPASSRRAAGSSGSGLPTAAGAARRNWSSPPTGALRWSALMLPLEDLGAPMDVFWFRLAQDRRPGRRAARHRSRRGRLLVLIDRGDYWQCAFLIPKGMAEDIGARNRAFRAKSQKASPGPRSRGERPDQIDRPALADGQARPADAVASARPAGDRRRRPCHVPDRRHRHQPRHPGRGRRRQYSRRAARRGRRRRCAASQGAGAPHVPDPRDPGRPEGRAGTRHRPAARPATPIVQAPLAVRLLDRFPLLRRIPGRIIGLGVRRERVRSPSRLRRSESARHSRFEVDADRLEELLGGHPRLIGADEDREVLGHLAAFDRLDADPLERFGEAAPLRACRRTCRDI